MLSSRSSGSSGPRPTISSVICSSMRVRSARVRARPSASRARPKASSISRRTSTWLARSSLGSRSEMTRCWMRNLASRNDSRSGTWASMRPVAMAVAALWRGRRRHGLRKACASDARIQAGRRTAAVARVGQRAVRQVPCRTGDVGGRPSALDSSSAVTCDATLSLPSALAIGIGPSCVRGRAAAISAGSTCSSPSDGLGHAGRRPR